MMILIVVLAVLKTCGQEDKGNLELSLSANGNPSLVLQRGYPLTLMVSAVNPAARQAALLLLMAEEDPEALPAAQREILEEQALGIAFGSRENPWYDIVRFRITYLSDNRVVPLALARMKPFAGEQILLGSDNAAIAWFGADPGVTRTLPPGSYHLLAYVPPQPGLNDDTLWSEPVSLKTTDPPLDDFLLLDDESFSFVVQYWLKRDECLNAEALFSSLPAERKENDAFFALQGEMYECLGDDVRALRYYREALDRYRQSPAYEPPEPLWEKIHELQERIGKINP